MTDRICVGVITGSYGLKGEVRVKSYCAVPEAIANYMPLRSENGRMSYHLTITAAIKDGFSATLANVNNKEDADDLRGTDLFATRDDLPNLPDDEYYYTDLVGLTVLDTGGVELGIVHAVQNHGAADLLEVNSPNLKTSVLIPFTAQSVPTVDLASGRIIADPPEGLFPDADADDEKADG